MKKLWIDDIREAPEGWTWAKDYFDAVRLLHNDYYDIVSFDHDLGCFFEGREYTGYDVLCWLEERQSNGLYTPHNLFVHSANPVGINRMRTVIDNIKRKYINDKVNNIVHPIYNVDG